MNHGIPKRDTPDAVILLVRLARANLGSEGKPTDRALINLAGMLNARLPAAKRVSPTDPRLREPLVGTKDDLVYMAWSAYDRCHAHPDYWSTFDRRADDLGVIANYFTWSRGLWKAAVNANDAVMAADQDSDDALPMLDSRSMQHTGVALYWLASLCTVVQAWEDRKFSDATIEATLSLGGDGKGEGSHRQKLELIKAGTERVENLNTLAFDFPEAVHDDEFMSWAKTVDNELYRFFRDALEGDSSSFNEWLERGLETIDPAMSDPWKRPNDPQAIVERMMALLLEPSVEAAHERQSEELIHRSFASPVAWVKAILTLGDTGALSADEAINFLGDVVISSDLGLDDERVRAITGQMERVATAAGVDPEDWDGTHTLPEYIALEDREQEQLRAVRVAFLRKHGAHEAAALLERSPEEFEEVVTRGDAEFKRRWPTNDRE